MSKKFKYAATLSLAATFITTLLSTGGSQAAAQSMNAPVAIAATFISQPVVQPLADVQQDAVADRSEANASSLAELVAETDIPAALSKELECLAGAVFFEAK
ncbi:MAG: cell wall hydrolase, partial [Novosphingobium sp. 35-62-5]